jgi:hypothetical protein
VADPFFGLFEKSTSLRVTSEHCSEVTRKPQKSEKLPKVDVWTSRLALWTRVQRHPGACQHSAAQQSAALNGNCTSRLYAPAHGRPDYGKQTCESCRSWKQNDAMMLHILYDVFNCNQVTSKWM